MKTFVVLAALVGLACLPLEARAGKIAPGDSRRGESNATESREIALHVEATVRHKGRLRILRLKRYREKLEAQLRCVRKEMVLDRHLLLQMERLFTPRISPSYYTNLAEVYSALDKAVRMEQRLVELISMARREGLREERFTS